MGGRGGGGGGEGGGYAGDSESLPVRQDRKDTLEREKKREHEQLAGGLVCLVRLNMEGHTDKKLPRLQVLLMHRQEPL